MSSDPLIWECLTDASDVGQVGLGVSFEIILTSFKTLKNHDLIKSHENNQIKVDWNLEL